MSGDVSTADTDVCVCQELERVKATSRKASRAQRDILMAKRFEEEQQRKKEVNSRPKYESAAEMVFGVLLEYMIRIINFYSCYVNRFQILSKVLRKSTVFYTAD